MGLQEVPDPRRKGKSNIFVVQYIENLVSISIVGRDQNGSGIGKDWLVYYSFLYI